MFVMSNGCVPVTHWAKIGCVVCVRVDNAVVCVVFCLGGAVRKLYFSCVIN
jgi:hypothetical protein